MTGWRMAAEVPTSWPPVELLSATSICRPGAVADRRDRAFAEAEAGVDACAKYRRNRDWCW